MIGTACVKLGNPENDNVNFDNLGNSALLVFGMFTLDGWSDTMYLIRDVKHTVIYDMFFLIAVYVGGFFVLNLIAAIQFQYYDTIKFERH